MVLHQVAAVPHEKETINRRYLQVGGARVNHVGRPHPVKGRQNDDVMPLGMVGRKANLLRAGRSGTASESSSMVPGPSSSPASSCCSSQRLELATYVPVVKSEMSVFGRLRELRPPRAPGTKVLG